MPADKEPTPTTVLSRDVAQVLARSGLPFAEQAAAIGCIELLIQHWGDEELRAIRQEFDRTYGRYASAVMIDNYVVHKT